MQQAVQNDGIKPFQKGAFRIFRGNKISGRGEGKAYNNEDSLSGPGEGFEEEGGDSSDDCQLNDVDLV
jgi:hypothetical protein